MLLQRYSASRAQPDEGVSTVEVGPAPGTDVVTIMTGRLTRSHLRARARAFCSCLQSLGSHRAVRGVATCCCCYCCSKVILRLVMAGLVRPSEVVVVQWPGTRYSVRTLSVQTL